MMENFIQFLVSLPAGSQTPLWSLPISIQSVFTLCSLVNHIERNCQNAILRPPIHGHFHSLRMLAMGPGSTDLILPLSRVNEHWLR